MKIQCPLCSEMLEVEHICKVIEYPCCMETTEDWLQWATTIMGKTGLRIFADKCLDYDKVVPYIMEHFPYERQMN